jgi:hypothetical protein
MNRRITSGFAYQYRDDYGAGLSICILLVFLVCLASAMCGCSGAMQLSSAWRDREIVVDGSDSDWRGATAYIKGSNLSLGIRNDNDYLYACVIIMDRQMQMQMMALGFTVWFDPEGGKDKVFGIHFPLGMEGPRPATALEGRDNAEEFQKITEQSQRELEIMGPGKKDRQRMLLMQVQGINVQIGSVQGFLVYELKVPLRKSADHPYAIGIDSVQAIGVGFETTELNLERMKEQLGGMPEGGGNGGPPMGGGGMPPGGGGRPGGGGPPGGGPGMGPPGGERSASLKLWTRVQLAPSNTSAAK